MDELIDILTPDGKLTGKTALKSEAHKNGWFHATVHIWLFTSDEKILPPTLIIVGDVVKLHDKLAWYEPEVDAATHWDQASL